MSRVTINKFNNSVKMFDIYSASVDTILVLVECVCVCVFGAVFCIAVVFEELNTKNKLGSEGEIQGILEQHVA